MRVKIFRSQVPKYLKEEEKTLNNWMKKNEKKTDIMFITQGNYRIYIWYKKEGEK